ncbi:MAG: L,D-transpeptidase family protein [Gammaproteobacteria bacterium]
MRYPLNYLFAVNIPFALRLLLAAAAAVLLNACQTAPPPRISYAPEVPAPVHRYPLTPDQTVIGNPAEMETQEYDTLPMIGRFFGLGFDEISRANASLDPWIPETGATVKLPLRFILPEAPRRGIVLNLSAKRLFYYPKDKPDSVYTYPVGIGREGWETPLGLTRIVNKKEHPTWTVPASVLREHKEKGDPLPKVVAAGPDNPLGDYAMRLAIPGYLIHGTNMPYGVGMAVSHGCVRLYPEDIAKLFNQTSTGTQVRLVDQPYLTAWREGRLFLQAYAPVDTDKKHVKSLVDALMKRLKRIERDSKKAVDWKKVETVLARSDGVAEAILLNDDEAPVLTRVGHPPPHFGGTVPPPLTPDTWKLLVTTYANRDEARRFAAMLNHEGPPIPAHTVEVKDSFAVVAGPFKQKREAESAAKRIRLHFSLEARLLTPDAVRTNRVENDGLFAGIDSIFD